MHHCYLSILVDDLGYGAWLLQSVTPSGTRSLRGLVSTLAGFTITERSATGLRREVFKPLDPEGFANPPYGPVERDDPAGPPGTPADLGPDLAGPPGTPGEDRPEGLEGPVEVAVNPRRRA